MRGRGGRRGSWRCQQGARRPKLGQQRRGAGGRDGTRWRLGSGADKRDLVQVGVVGEESEALVPFIGRRRRGAVGGGGCNTLFFQKG
jgi:hypothetical protein